MSKKVTAALAENWQRCRPELLPRAFYAYDQAEHQSERAVSYHLSRSQTDTLIKQAKDRQKKAGAFCFSDGQQHGFRFVIHLGLHADKGWHAEDRIPDRPAFVLSVQALATKDDWQRKCLPMQWTANGRFSTANENRTLSSANAIPGASAFLFVHSWLETPEAELAQPFTASSRVLGQRVKAYSFSPAESESMLQDLEAARSRTSGDTVIFTVHLGKGLAVWDHPFSFRPVVDIHNAIDLAAGPQPVHPLVSRQVNEDGDSYYDYGGPYPPKHPGGD